MASETLAAGRPVRARPSPDAPPLAVAAGGAVPVYGRFGAYRLMEAGGQRGWAGDD